MPVQPRLGVAHCAVLEHRRFPLEHPSAPRYLFDLGGDRGHRPADLTLMDEGQGQGPHATGWTGLPILEGCLISENV